MGRTGNKLTEFEERIQLLEGGLSKILRSLHYIIQRIDSLEELSLVPHD